MRQSRSARKARFFVRQSRERSVASSSFIRNVSIWDLQQILRLRTALGGICIGQACYVARSGHRLGSGDRNAICHVYTVRCQYGGSESIRGA